MLEMEGTHEAWEWEGAAVELDARIGGHHRVI
jgi:hypothetical protein